VLDGAGHAVRRVVAATDAAGRGAIESDRAVEPAGPPELPAGVEAAVLWVVEDSPARPDQGETPGSPMWRVGPVPDEGARWTVLTIHPEAAVHGLHKTDTVDLVQVIEGEIWLVMEDGDERLLRAGDCVVQRAAVHTWDNRCDRPCRMSVVMLSTLPRHR